MGIYRLTSGRHRRFENGRLASYGEGDLVELSDKEVARLAHRVVPVSVEAKRREAKRPDAEADKVEFKQVAGGGKTERSESDEADGDDV